ncbi:MAG: S-ribosylhomocysteine lyase [Acutalibacteraceae bacterium]
MKKIASFTVNHDILEPGIYVSRVDGNITTYDIRFIKPNTPPFLEPKTMHTIEHLFATYARNGRLKNKVIYFGPMGCCTGFYFLIKDVSVKEALEYIKEIVRLSKEHTGEIPGNKKEECGNYLFHDTKKAQEALCRYYEVIKNIKEENTIYPE